MPDIVQLVPGATPGNAIYDEAAVLQAALRQWGYRAGLYGERIHPELAAVVPHFSACQPGPDDVVIFHYALGSALSDYVKTLPARLLLIYHNVTPPYFLTGANPWLRQGAARGRRELPDFAGRTTLALAVSEFNRQELIAAGFGQTAVLPLIQPEALYHTPPDPAVLARYDDGWTNLLFVGRIAPNKRQEDAIRALAVYRQLNPRSRLLLVGAGDGPGGQPGAYGRWLAQIAGDLGVQDAVHFGGHVSLAELAAYYRVASIFLCLSEHEGFCGPLVESMRFRLPIIAYESTAVPETLGGSGILVTRKQFTIIAELIHLLATDTALRQKLIRGQLARAAAFDPATLLAQFRAHLESVLNTP